MNILAYEADTSWNRGIPCIFLKTLIHLYLLRLLLYSLTYCIKDGIYENNLEINKKNIGLWGIYGLKQGISCNILNLFIKSYLICVLFCLINLSYRVSKLRIFRDDLKKCLRMSQICLHEAWKKTFWNFFLINMIISLHEYVCKCAMVIWNYITW